jgi:hypothetical protein
VAGQQSVSGFIDGFGTNALFTYPSRPKITADGSAVYVVENGNKALRKVIIGSGEVLTVVSGITPTIQTILLSSDNSFMILTSTSPIRVFKISLIDGPVIFNSDIYMSYTYAGSYFIWNFAFMTRIPADTPSCKACADGKYSLDGLACATCPAGSFCVTTSLAPQACPSGVLPSPFSPSIQLYLT